MNADASAGVRTQLSVEARFPQLLWIGIGLLGGAAIFGLLAGGLLYAATSSRTREETMTQKNRPAEPLRDQ